ncbi:MAG: hypothetical protein CME36_11170 [unclassified Hahellaceae]|nr:hypothetical protein [Hahellaceae bacterium]
MKCRIVRVAWLAGFMTIVGQLPATAYGYGANAEVTRNSSGSWLSRVDGGTVYQGGRYFDAVNAAINSMGPGTINIRNSGNSGPDGGRIHAIRPQPNQTLDFHGHQIHASGGDLIVPIYCDRRDNITVKNLRVTGSPRYGVWFRGCSDVVLENVSMDLSAHSYVGLGIRVDASTGPANNLVIRGRTVINGSHGHGIETYGVDGFTIGDVQINNSGGAGLLLNDSRNGTVGRIVGDRNNRGGGYATFRVANTNGPNVHVKSVRSRNSGRGFFSVSGSHGTTIEEVDIADSTSQGIFLEDARDTYVLSGSVAYGRPNCQLVRTASSSVQVAGCESLGGGSPVRPDQIHGTYRIAPVHSGMALDVAQCGRTNGVNIQQWDWLDNSCQKFEIQPVEGEWHRIASVNAVGKVLDVAGASMEDAANVLLWGFTGGANQQFRFQSAGAERWRIVSRHSGQCLDVSARSRENGANLVQWPCTANSENQMFRLIRAD